MLGAMLWCTAPMKKLWPSGAARDARPAPSVPPAPPLLSMTNWRPTFLVICANSGRAKASVPPPGGKGTTMVTGLVGHAEAWAWTQGAASALEAAAMWTRAWRRVVWVMLRLAVLW
jgi:hypothetical protein